MFSSIKLYLKGRPLLANCITYGGLYMGAEFSQQSMLHKVLVSVKLKYYNFWRENSNFQPEKKEDYDFKLISRYGVLGTAVFPPILFYWYKWLDGRFVGTAVKTIATKVVLDQAVSAPIILGLFYIGNKNSIPSSFRFDFYHFIITTFKNSGMSLMEGRPDIFQELREKFVDTFKVSFLSGKKMCFLSVSKMHDEKENHRFF